MHHWENLAKPVILIVHRLCSWVGLRLPFSLGSLPAIFRYYESQSSGRQLPGQFQLHSCKSCVQGCATFSCDDLHSHSGRQSTATAIAYIIFGVYWLPMANNSKGSVPWLGICIFVRKSVYLWRSTIILCGIILFIYVYIHACSVCVYF